MKINIAFGISSDWCQYASITIASILINANKKDDYSFYILSNGITEEHKKIFYRLNKIKKSDYIFIEMDDSFFDGAIHDWLGVSASYRLRLASVTNIEKILYLDADIIAMEDVAELYSTDISSYYLAAVMDKCSDMMKNRVSLGECDIFFNSGVQLINLKKFRENNLESLFLKRLRESTYYTDQDVLNDICRGHILPLHIKYNIMPYGKYAGNEYEYYEAISNPVLIHFTLKPWKDYNSHWADKWHEYYKKVLQL